MRNCVWAFWRFCINFSPLCTFKCVFGFGFWLVGRFSCGNVCGLSGNFVIRSSKQASYAPLIGSLHAKSLPAHNASNMLHPIITTIPQKWKGHQHITIEKEKRYSELILSMLAVVRSVKHACGVSVWTFRHLDCYSDTPHPPHEHMPAFHSEFSAIWGDGIFIEFFCASPLDVTNFYTLSSFQFSTSVQISVLIPF